MAFHLNLIPMDKFRDGDEAVFKEVYNSFKGKVYLFCFRRVKNTQDAEDLVSQIFIKIWIYKTTIKDSDHLEKFITTVIHTTVIDHIRVNSRRPSSHPYSDINTTEISDPQFDPHFLLMEKEYLGWVAKAPEPIKKELAEMRFQYGSILRYYALEGLAVDDIASRSAISRDTVLKHLDIGKQKLLKKLQDNKHFPPALLKRSIISYFVEEFHRFSSTQGKDW